MKGNTVVITAQESTESIDSKVFHTMPSLDKEAEYFSSYNFDELTRFVEDYKPEKVILYTLDLLRN